MLWGYQLFLRFKKTSILVIVILLLVGVSTPVLAASKSKSSTSSKTSSKSKGKSIAKCDTNYSKCVPVASDVDCKPGSGNGPKFVTGPKRVLKKDVYKLDVDKDRIACERN